nr:LIM domain-containing protein WLIM2b-like [Tanacetum cinerariifolium]GEZ95288.1 LIM domain-containing protein WLIM2b-like [Tanacetum cinerariifolium]
VHNSRLWENKTLFLMQPYRPESGENHPIKVALELVPPSELCCCNCWSLGGNVFDHALVSEGSRAIRGEEEMAFTGTLDKCKVCEKTVYFLEMITADGVNYHKNCFTCSQCNGKLTMSTYSSLEGVLFCKPHFEQKFKERGGLPKVTPANKPQEGKAPSRLAALFSGTQEKCAVCKKTVYPLEKVTVEGEFYHKACFRCTQGGCFLTPSNYAALDGNLFCKPHFSQLFKEKGSYAHLKQAATIKKSGAVSAEESSADQEASVSEEPTATDEATAEEEES